MRDSLFFVCFQSITRILSMWTKEVGYRNGRPSFDFFSIHWVVWFFFFLSIRNRNLQPFVEKVCLCVHIYLCMCLSAHMHICTCRGYWVYWFLSGKRTVDWRDDRSVNWFWRCAVPPGPFGEWLAPFTYPPSTNCRGRNLQPFERLDSLGPSCIKNPFSSQMMWDFGMGASWFTRAMKVQSSLKESSLTSDTAPQDSSHVQATTMLSGNFWRISVLVFGSRRLEPFATPPN